MPPVSHATHAAKEHSARMQTTRQRMTQAAYILFIPHPGPNIEAGAFCTANVPMAYNLFNVVLSA